MACHCFSYYSRNTDNNVQLVLISILFSFLVSALSLILNFSRSLSKSLSYSHTLSLQELWACMRTTSTTLVATISVIIFSPLFLSSSHAICNACNLQHMQFATHAICYMCNLPHVQFATCAICHTCNLQHMQFATCAINKRAIRNMCNL